MNIPMQFCAHSKNKAGGGPEPVEDHLKLVTNGTVRRASYFGAEAEAAVTGPLHDLGKCSLLFLGRIAGKEKGLDHWTPGALTALKRYGKAGSIPALAILGHHAGLPDDLPGDICQRAIQGQVGYPKESSLRLTLEASRNLDAIEDVLSTLATKGIRLPKTLEPSFDRALPPLARMLDARMLFSALVDADFVETEAWFNGDKHGNRKYRPEGPELEPSRALDILLRYIQNLELQAEASGKASGNVMALRHSLLESCLDAAGNPTGLFDLTAPTGAGKTLAMLAFALAHAARHKLRRVVVVIPFLSIIEQTALIYREVFEPHFGSQYVLEHHSLVGIRENKGEARDSEDEARRLRDQLAENWDAPLIVTTSVQALESLFAHRPASCRKLHQLAKSVILFDEVQTLPGKWVLPVLGSLAHLSSKQYGSSIVFSTATQPAFSTLANEVGELCGRGWTPSEIVGNRGDLFAWAQRARIDVSDIREGRKQSWDEVAGELAKPEHDQILCIVNLKRHAHHLFELLRKNRAKGLFHLSTSMCPAHRKTVLDEVRGRLKHRESCLLISTQCIEAGVDVDFPVVWRALGPLEAIIQAAGRCNRHGIRLQEGLVKIFEPIPGEDEKNIYPPGYGEATSEAAEMIRGQESHFLDATNLGLIRQYYSNLYDAGNAQMSAKDGHTRENFADAVKREGFATVAMMFRLIEQEAINVLVPYDQEAFADLRDLAQASGTITREWVHRARLHSVSVMTHGKDRERLQGAGILFPIKVRGEESDWWYLSDHGEEFYDPELGLNPPKEAGLCEI